MLKAIRSTIILSLTLIVGVAQAQNDSHIQSLRGSNAAMLSLMEDEYIQKAYRSMQGNDLNTNIDLNVREYFENHPLIGPTFDELISVQEKIVEDFIKQAEMGMYRIREHSPGELGRLDKIIVETMVSLGFNREAIQNRKTYLALGEVNAFTVSGSEKHPIVVVNTGLLEKLGDLEAKAVIAHEFGHILSKHTVISIVSRVLLSFTGAYLTNGQMAFQSMQNELNSITQDLKQMKTCVHEDHSHMEHLLGPGRQHFSSSDSDKALNEVIGKMISANPNAILQASVEFLSYIAQNGRELYLKPQTIGYFKKAVEVIKMNAQDPDGEALLNTEDFPVHANAVINALSRMKETSADHYSGSIIPNEIVASAFLKLVGPNAFERKDRKIFFKDIQEQVREFMEKYDYEQRVDAMGTSHPALNLRITDILNISKYPSLAIANPFLRLMMVREQTMLKVLMLGQQVKQLEAEIAEGLPEEIKQQLDAEQQKAALAQVDDVLLQMMIEEEGYQKALPKVEKEILGLMLNYNKTKRNPRVENLIQFLSFEKELKFHQANMMATEIQNLEAGENAEEKAEEIKSMQDMVKALREAALVDDPIVDSLLAGLAADSQYIALLNELKAVQNMDAGESLRAKITNFKKYTSLPRSADPNKCENLLIM